MNEFEIKLKEYFPEIYELYVLAKDKAHNGGGETHVYKVIESLLVMNRDETTGSLYIGYSKGKITKIALNKDVLAFKPNGLIDNEKGY